MRFKDLLEANQSIPLSSEQLIQSATIVMQKLVQVYSHLKVPNRTAPAAPDTTKFTASISGDISTGPIRTPGGTYSFPRNFPAFMKLGSGLDHTLRSDILENFYTEFLKETGIQLAQGTYYTCADGNRFMIEKISGTNWGGFGLMAI